MAKHKLQRFAENQSFPNVIEPRLPYPPIGFKYRGRWDADHFGNNNPIVLELGCGRGEYTIALAKKYPEKNFIGVDIKGARLWRGAKTGIEENIPNAAFLRVMIDQIAYYFDENEVSEIWITFPDPQPQISREKKRLTSPNFINKYLRFLKPDSVIHLKTDNLPLYQYTLEVANQMNYTILQSTDDLYNGEITDDILEVKTTYEKIFMRKGFKICYLKFSVNPAI